MQEPSTPIDEAARLADLCRLKILDTAAEARFDRITRTAQRLFQVPIALVSLVDANRQWFKSSQGIDASETPRNVSFCGHAVLQEGAFVIPDATADARFADNPLVTGAPFVRFYAGMPLHGAQGHRVGTLCLVDQRPRRFSDGDVAALTDLSAWAELELNVYTIEHATAVARNKEERLQAILDHAGDAIITVSESGRVETFNPQASRIFGYAPEQIIGQHVAQLLDGAIPGEVDDYLDRLRQKTKEPGGSLKREVQARRADGDPFPAEMTVARLHSGRLSGFTGILRDISQRKEVDRMKNDFISTVSHELRTPLTSIRGSLGLVLGGAMGAVPDKAQSLLGVASSNCDRLVRLINDMLDIEKIESGQVRFDCKPLLLQPLVQQAMAATQAYGEQLGVRFTFENDAPDARVLADADRLLQVVVNLLSNAAKFSPAGGRVEVRLARSAGAPPQLRLAVADRGTGVPAEFRERIFSRFSQAEASGARQKPGTGLGLSISKAIIEQLGGRIGFVDRLGGGSEFFISLPELAHGVPGAGTAAANPPPAVLVCEDDADIARLIGLLLEGSGVPTAVARNAQEARAMLAARAFKAMTLDIGLPDEDGLSLLQWLRAQQSTAQLPVVVVSARDSAEAIRSGAAFAALDWITKPIDEERLLAAVRRAVRGPRQGPATVLYVEDDLDLAQVVGTLVADTCELVHAPTLAGARALLGDRSFDLILLDLTLPDGNGAELLAGLPAVNAATPVVIFSAGEVSREVAQHVEAALVKSRTTNEELLVTVARLVKRSAQESPA